MSSRPSKRGGVRQPPPTKDEAPPVIEVNGEWTLKRNGWIATIVGAFGEGIQTTPPLTTAEGGYIQPFDQIALNDMLADDHAADVQNPTLSYTAGVNIMSLDHSVSMTPHVPVVENRVKELKSHIATPSSCPFTIDVAVTWGKKAKVPWGKLVRVSPEQVTDAILWKVAERIEAGADDNEKEGWKRMVLSATCRFFPKLDNSDKRYYHGLNVRESKKAEARAVGLTTIQVICDVWSFKVRKEVNCKLSAQAVADIYAEHVTLSADSEPRSPGAIDSCLTIYKRIMLIPELREVCLRLEERTEGSAMNSIFKFDEMIKKCGTTKKIGWWLTKLEDELRTKARESGELTIKSIRTGHPKSVTDMYLCKLSIKHLLLGSELDRRQIDSKCKALMRDMFESVSCYRSMLRPLDDPNFDSSFLSVWPVSASRYLDMIENLVYAHNPTDDGVLRLGLKNGKEPHEILTTYNPFKTWLEQVDEAIETEQKRSREDERMRDSNGRRSVASAVTTVPADSPAKKKPSPSAEYTESLESFNTLAGHTVGNSVKLLVEPRAGQALIELWKAAPLAVLRSTADNTNIVVLADLNLWGMCATAPDLRKPSIKPELFAKLFSTLRQARCNAAEVQMSTLPIGDVWVMIDAGQNRRAQFRKQIKPTAKAHPTLKKQGKTVWKNVTLYKSEASMADRKHRMRGHAQLKLTEGIHCAYNGATVIDRRDNKCFEGTNRSDTLGPVQAVKFDLLARLPKADRAKFWGERLKQVGGRNPGDSDASQSASDDAMSDVDEEEVVSDDDAHVPIAHHQLPSTTYENIFASCWAKSVIDLCPGIGVQALTALKDGIGYVGLCHNEEQRSYILKFLHTEVLKLMVNSSSRFYNISFAKLQEEKGNDVDDEEDKNEENDTDDETADEGENEEGAAGDNAAGENKNDGDAADEEEKAKAAKAKAESKKRKAEAAAKAKPAAKAKAAANDGTNKSLAELIAAAKAKAAAK